MSEQPKVDMSFMRTLKTEPNGRCFNCLGEDGVMRVWHFDDWNVIDAVGLEPAQIREILERFPFDQAKEDNFRGRDGRLVSKEQMFHPPEELIPVRPSKELVQEHERAYEERKTNASLQRPSGGVCKPVKRSTYNLDPI